MGGLAVGFIELRWVWVWVWVGRWRWRWRWRWRSWRGRGERIGEKWDGKDRGWKSFSAASGLLLIFRGQVCWDLIDSSPVFTGICICTPPPPFLN